MCSYFKFKIFLKVVFIYLFYVYEYTVAVFRHQKRASDLITGGCFLGIELGTFGRVVSALNR